MERGLPAIEQVEEYEVCEYAEYDTDNEESQFDSENEGSYEDSEPPAKRHKLSETTDYSLLDAPEVDEEVPDSEAPIVFGVTTTEDENLPLYPVHYSNTEQKEEAEEEEEEEEVNACSNFCQEYFSAYGDSD